MTAKVETVQSSASVATLLETFDRGHVAMVMGDDRFLASSPASTC